MKRLIAIVLISSVLLSGCNIADVKDRLTENNEDVMSYGGINSVNDIAGEINKNTGIEVHDNAPVLDEANVEEFLEYFKNSEDYVINPEFIDERNPFEEQLADEAQKAGKGIAEFYNEQNEIVTYLTNFVDKNVDKHNENAGFTDMILMIFLPMQSMELAMGATLTEQQPWETISSGVTQAFTFMGGSNASVTRNAAHDYTATYTNDEGNTVTDYFKANPDTGFQMLSYNNGEISEIFEYVHTEGNIYIWQTSYERLVMEYDGEKILKCAYTKLNEDETPYGESELILNNSQNCDFNWACQRDNYHTKIIYDGTTLKITATAFLFGGMCEAEITDVIIP